MSILPDVEQEMQRIVSEAQEEDIFLRLIGGLAFKMHCPHAAHRALEREYPDIDFVTDKVSARQLLEFLPSLGYTPNKTLNTLSGDQRQLYYDEINGRQIDIFIGDFEMCQDALDLLALLLDHEVGHSDDETINVDIIAELCAKDWGLYTTISLNIDKLQNILAQGDLELDETQAVTIQKRLAAIQKAMDAAPKTMQWKLRAKVGTRVRWYQEVEEVRR